MRFNQKTRIIAMAFIFAVLSTGAFAEPMCMQDNDTAFRNGHHFPGPYVKAELAAVKTNLGDKPIGELTLNQLSPYWDNMSLAISKDNYLNEAFMMSFMMPGAGQFRNGDALEGLGFMALNVSVIAGTLIGSYFLLPADLRFDKMNYFSASFKTIGDTWYNHSFNDYLPSIGAMILGCLIDFGVRVWSASDAYSASKTAIDSGKIKMEPQIGFGYLGMRMRF